MHGLGPARSPSPARSPRAVIGNDAFQEADITGITMPITKHNWLVTDAGRHRRARSARRSTSRRPAGPARCSSTSRKDVLIKRRPTFDWPEEVDLPGYKPTHRGQPSSRSARPSKLILAAERPVILAGGGVIRADAADELLQASPRPGSCRSCTTLLGLGALPRHAPARASACRACTARLHGSHRACRRPTC